MQGLVKATARVKKFVPHSPDPSHVVTDAKEVSPITPTPRYGRLAPRLRPEGFDQLAHDARNVLSALRLYCELLAEPGVLTPVNCHYARNWRRSATLRRSWWSGSRRHAARDSGRVAHPWLAGVLDPNRR